MNHGPIVVSENGFKAMEFSSDFDKYAREQGIRNPFEVSRKLISKPSRTNPDGSISINIEWDEKTGKIKDYPDEPTRVERDNYIIMRDKYIARRCFEELGYEMFLAHTNPDKTYDISYMRSMDEFVPCNSANRQCSFDCHRYAECVINGAWKLE